MGVRHSQLTLATHCIITDNMKFNLFRHIKDQEDDSPFITSTSEHKYLPKKFRKGKTKSSLEYSEPRHRKADKLLQDDKRLVKSVPSSPAPENDLTRQSATPAPPPSLAPPAPPSPTPSPPGSEPASLIT